MNILEATTDDNLFASWFARGDWAAWFAFLAALFGLELDDKQREIYTGCTGRTEPPHEPFTEAWLVVGRRGGKSFIVALVGAFLGAFVDYRPHLQAGERATILILASDRRQARVIMRYLVAFFDDVPMLAALVQRRTEEQIDLTNRVTIEICTASFRSTRGYTIAAALCDETAYWRSDELGANPDSEILAALRPGMATIPGARLLCIGSPYAKRGEMWRAYQRYYGKDDAPVLVWQAPSRTMNPTLSQRVVDDAFERDPASAQAEYGAEFRQDIEAFISDDVLRRLCRSEPLVLPPQSGIRYQAFVDPAGGGADGFALCIGHTESSGRIVVDLLTERIRQNPSRVTKEYAGILREYGLREVTGDKYGAAWTVDAFQQNGIHYKHTDKNRSELYSQFLGVANSERVELPPDAKLLRQFSNLERRTGVSGRDTIDHGRGLHDDLSNACAGVVNTATGEDCIVGFTGIKSAM